MKTHWSRRSPGAFVLLAVPTLLTATLLFGCAERQKLPPEQRTFFAAYKAIKFEMTEQEVDDLLKDYPSVRNNTDKYEQKENNFGEPHIRPSVNTKRYDSAKNANECDFYILVYFDESGRVVGKSVGEYLK